MKVFIVVLSCIALSGWTQLASACQGFDNPCHGNNGAQADCCGGMHCQKNDPLWAEGRCYYNPGSGDEDASSSSSSSSTSTLPRASCDASTGLLCIPDACEKKTCTLMPDAKCLADRCGCEARFFRYNEQEKAFQDYSRLCHIAEHLTKVERFVNRTQLNDEGSLSPVDLHAVAERYRTFNKLLVEILLDAGRYLQQVVKSDPSQENIDRLRSVANLVKTLEESARGHSNDTMDRVTERKLSKWIKIGGKLIQMLVNDQVPSASDMEADNNNVSERAIFDWLKKGVQLAGKVVKSLSDENGQFADEIASGKVAISDKSVRDQLKQLEGRGYLSTILKASSG